jgi:sulfatase modifying factor 1
MNHWPHVNSAVFICSLLLFGNAVAQCQTRVEPLGLIQKQPTQGRFVETDKGFMIPYKATIPGSEVVVEMVPIPGGTFVLGSPATEPERNSDEGPQIEVKVSPFWMSKFETTWEQYQRYMELQDVFRQFQSQSIRVITPDNQIDAVTAPSILYDADTVYESGDDPRQPAVMMTQYAAKQYTKWLSALTGEFYRLPSEAEWEYACRANSKTAYYFGDDPEQLDQHAWFEENSESRTHRVGQKEPNGWGLYDMHGNVAEWVLDAYTARGYDGQRTGNALESIRWPTAAFPRVVRGGSFELDAASCRSAARLGSDDEEWKDEDPNLPASPWWYTTSPTTGIGFRIVRPLIQPESRVDKEKFWQADVDEIREDVTYRLEEAGNGAIGLVDPQLPQAIESLKK